MFKPKTSGLRELTAPKIPLRRLAKKKRPVPYYGLEIGDDEEVLDYGLEDLFGQQIPPQDEKQIVSKPPSYKDVLDEIASGEKNIYINPDYKFDLTLPTTHEEGYEDFTLPTLEDLPPAYEEEGIDYAILEEDQINEVLDNLNLPNYDDIELCMTEEEMNDTRRKSYLKKIVKNAKFEKNRLNGYKMDVTKEINKGLITEADAQYRRRIISDTEKVLTDYINNNKQKLESIKVSGLKRRKKGKKGGRIIF